jgi:hypothetical protein
LECISDQQKTKESLKFNKINFKKLSWDDTELNKIKYYNKSDAPEEISKNS